MRLVMFALAVLLIALLTACAKDGAQAQVQLPVPVEPKILHPERPRVAREQQVAPDGGPTDFVLDYGKEMTPPQGCLDRRRRTNNPRAC